MTTPYGTPQQPGYGYQPNAFQQPAPYGSAEHAYQQQLLAAYAPARRATTTLGTWSLILALSGFLIPIGLNSIAAIILGVMGIVQEQRRGMSIAGLSIGGFVLLIYIPFVWSVLAIVLSLTPLLFLPFLY